MDACQFDGELSEALYDYIITLEHPSSHWYNHRFRSITATPIFLLGTQIIDASYKRGNNPRVEK